MNQENMQQDTGSSPAKQTKNTESNKDVGIELLLPTNVESGPSRISTTTGTSNEKKPPEKQFLDWTRAFAPKKLHSQEQKKTERTQGPKRIQQEIIMTGPNKNGSTFTRTLKIDQLETKAQQAEREFYENPANNGKRFQGYIEPATRNYLEPDTFLAYEDEFELWSERSLEGQMGKITKDGFSMNDVTNALGTGLKIAEMVGMMNPTEMPGQSIQETPKPPGDEVFGAPITSISTLASEMETAAVVVQDTISQTFQPMKPPRKQGGYAGETSQFTYANMAERPFLVNTFSWDTTMASEQEIFAIRIPHGLLSPDNLLQTLFRQHYYAQWDSIEFTIHYNANQFTAGLMSMSFIPSEYYDDTSNNFVRAVTSNRVDMNPSAMTEGKLVVPFVYNQNWMTPSDVVGNVMRQSGYLVGYVIHPLKGTESDSISLPIRIIGQLQGLRLACPMPPYVGDLFPDPVVGQAKGDTTSVLYVPRTNVFANYEEGTKVLKNTQNENLAMDLIQDEGDNMDINMLVRKPGIERMFSWSVEMTPGTILMDWIVNPAPPNETYGSPRTPLQFFSRFAARWNGNIRHKLIVAKSAFHTGKLAILLVPSSYPVTSTNYMAYNHLIMDLKDDNILEFESAFMGNHSTLRTQRGSHLKGVTYANRVVVVVHTQLQANSTMQNSVDASHWISGGENFQLYNVVPPLISAAIPFTFNVANVNAPGNRFLVAKFPVLGDTILINMFDTANIFSPGPIPPGVYRASELVQINTIVDEVLYEISTTMWYSNGTEFSNSALFPGGVYGEAGVTYAFPIAADLVLIPSLEGQSGVASAMHDKLQTPPKQLGKITDNSDPNMEYEPLNSLLQILERPHTFSPANTNFNGYTNERVDTFGLINSCFAFTTGQVQTVTQGYIVQSDPSGEQVYNNLNGIVRLPTEENFVLVDHPPMTDGAIKMNIQNRLVSASRPACQLTNMIFTAEPGTGEKVCAIRAGQNFQHHLWCGIPTYDQTMQFYSDTEKENNRLNEPEFGLDTSLANVIKTLRERQSNLGTMILEGQMGKDEPGPSRAMKYLEKRFKKSPAPLPPKTESHNLIQSSNNPFEEESEEEAQENEASTPASSTTSGEDVGEASKTVFSSVYKAVKRPGKTMKKIEDTAETISSVSKEIAGSIKKTTTNIDTKLDKMNDRMKKVTKKAEHMIHRGENLLETAFQKVEHTTKRFDDKGLLGMLFGDGESEKYTIIKILLVDAIECVAIRSKVKWAGMIVKLCMALGLNQKIVTFIKNSFLRSTQWSAPHESQEGGITGQSGGTEHLPLIASVMAAIVMGLSFIWSGAAEVNTNKFPTMWDWIAERCRQTANIDRGLESLEKMHAKLYKWTVKMVSKFFPIDPATCDILQEEEFLRLSKQIVNDSAELLAVDKLVTIFQDWELREKVFSIDREYVKLMAYAANPEINKKYGQLYSRVDGLIKQLRARVMSIANNPQVRIDPFHISFYGASGAGKSYLMNAAAYVLSRAQNIPKENAFYARTQNTKHFDNYKGQEWMGMDDIDQQDDPDAAGEMITIKSNVPLVLPMAYLEAKGCMFTSRGLLTSTNTAYPEPSSIRHKAAYKRRRNILVECIAIGPMKEDMSHLRFFIRDPIHSGRPPIAGPFRFEELMFYLACKHSAYLEVQYNLVSKNDEGTKFKKLYRYFEGDEKSRLKIYELVYEFLTPKLRAEDYVGDIDDIVTRATIPETVVREVETIPEDFTATLRRVDPRPPRVTEPPPEVPEVQPEVFPPNDDDNQRFANDELEGQSGWPIVPADVMCGDETAIRKFIIDSLELIPTIEHIIYIDTTMHLVNNLREIRNLSRVDFNLAVEMARAVSEFDAPPTIAEVDIIAAELEAARRQAFEETEAQQMRDYEEETWADGMSNQTNIPTFQQEWDEDMPNVHRSTYTSCPPPGKDKPSRFVSAVKYIKTLYQTMFECPMTIEIADVMATISDHRFGQGIRDLPPELPPGMRTLRPGLEKVREDYVKWRRMLRSDRLRFFKDESDELFLKMEFAMDMVHYCWTEATDEEGSRFHGVKYAACAGFFMAQAIKCGLALFAHQFKHGTPLSRTIKNLNNRILPNNLIDTSFVEAYRIMTEVAILPFSVMRRVVHECISWITTGIKYCFTTLYTCFSERCAPELHSIIKIGIFLIGGYGIYHLWKWSKTPKRLEGDPDPEVQEELRGEMQEDGNKMLKILTRTHIGMPHDGCKYEHYHQCETCKNVYAHTHAYIEAGHSWELLCRRCRVKKQNKQKEDARNGIQTEAPKDEGEKDVDPWEVDGEAVASSGGAEKSRYNKFKKLLRPKGESQTTKSRLEVFKSYFRSNEGESQEKKVIPENFTKNDPGNDKVLTGEACTDPTLLSVMPIIKKNQVRLYIEGHGYTGGLMIVGKVLVTVAHIVEGRHDRRLAYTVEHQGLKFNGLLDTFTDIYRPQPVTINNRQAPDDIVYIDLSKNKTLRSFRDIRSHLLLDEDMGRACGHPGILIEKGKDGEFTHHPLLRIDPVTDRVVHTGQGGERVRTHVAVAWQYSASLEKGSCGSPVMVRNTSCPQKLVGFHFAAFAGTTLGYAHLLTREMVDEVLVKMDEKCKLGFCDTGDIEGQCEQVFNCRPEDLPAEHGLKFVPQGRIIIVGRLPAKKVHPLPRKTGIVASPFKDKIFMHTSEPAILTDTDPRSPGDILQRGLNKYGRTPERVRDPRILEEITVHQLKKMEQASQNYNGPKRTLTEDEAINGIIGQPYIPPLRMDTSPGYPYVLLRPTGTRGRSFLFKQIGITKEGQPQYEAGPLLRRHLDEIWEGLLEGKVLHNYYLDCLKDERRSMHRLYKTRFFNIHTVAWLITYRRLYLASAALHLTKKFVLGTGLGLDMHGPDVTQMMNYLRETGDSFLEVDVKNWDGDLPSEELVQAFKAEAEWINLHEEFEAKNEEEKVMAMENARRREVLPYGIACRIHIIDNCVYLVFQGMPSGHGATAQGNSKAHDLQNYANWIELWNTAGLPELATCEAKDEYTREIAVGDDGGGTVDPEMRHLYHNESVAAIYRMYGMECQTPDKVGKEGIHVRYTNSDEFTFLKCGFERDHAYSSLWHMKMDPKVIYELTNWVTDSGDPYELFYANMDDALLFAHSHGREFYEKFRSQVNRVLHEENQPLLTKNYDHQRRLWLDKHGKTPM